METTVIVAIIAGLTGSLIAPSVQAWLNRKKSSGEAGLLTAQTAKTWQEVYDEQQKDIEAMRKDVRQMRDDIEAMETRLDKMKKRILGLLRGIKLLIAQIEELGHEPVWRPAAEDDDTDSI